MQRYVFAIIRAIKRELLVSSDSVSLDIAVDVIGA